VKIKYTNHAKKKFADLRIFGIIVTQAQIARILKSPKYRSQDNGNLVKAGDFDGRHNLRVVHKKEKDAIIIITFYIYRKGRYGEY